MKKRILALLMCSLLLMPLVASAQAPGVLCCNDMNVRASRTHVSDEKDGTHWFEVEYPGGFWVEECTFSYVEKIVVEKCTNCGTIHNTYKIIDRYDHKSQWCTCTC